MPKPKIIILEKLSEFKDFILELLTEHTSDIAVHVTSDEKTKLSGIATGAEVNQNAFSNVVVGSTTISADSKTDSLTLAGSNVTLTPDATNDKVTIGITKANVTTALGYTPPTTNTTYGVATSSTLGLVKSGTDITVDSSGNVSVNDDSHNHVISNVDGLQTALDGKASSSHTHNSYVNQNAFSNVTVGSTTIAADTTTDTLTLVAGSNVTITPDVTNDKITISSSDTDTHYSSNLYAGAYNGYANAETTNGNTFLILIENGSVKNRLKLIGDGATTVTSSSNGIITISSTNTDTKNTAGSTNSSSKLFLVGATSQSANPQTYSHDTAYVGTDGCLYSNSSKVVAQTDCVGLTETETDALM